MHLPELRFDTCALEQLAAAPPNPAGSAGPPLSRLAEGKLRHEATKWSVHANEQGRRELGKQPQSPDASRLFPIRTFSLYREHLLHFHCISY